MVASFFFNCCENFTSDHVIMLSLVPNYQVIKTLMFATCLCLPTRGCQICNFGDKFCGQNVFTCHDVLLSIATKMAVSCSVCS